MAMLISASRWGPAAAQDPALLQSAQDLLLKPRQQQVLELLALGHTNKQIGSALNIAAVTVRDVVQQLYQIFDALNRTDVVFKASCAGYLRQPSAPP
jgi:DNA-binding NarL/FixJ family response regulator